jgi:hypothetical protein
MTSAGDLSEIEVGGYVRIRRSKGQKEESESCQKAKILRVSKRPSELKVTYPPRLIRLVFEEPLGVIGRKTNLPERMRLLGA